MKNGVTLYTPEGTYDLNNPTDKLMKTLLDGVAEYYNAIRARCCHLGKINKVRNCNWYGAPPPYGYEIVDGKLSIHPEESKTVKIFLMELLFNKGKPSCRDQEHLGQRRNNRTERRFVPIQSINRLMQNTHHLGHYTYTDKKTGETIPCVCPQIVDETLWNNVQDIPQEDLRPKGTEQQNPAIYGYCET